MNLVEYTKKIKLQVNVGKSSVMRCFRYVRLNGCDIKSQTPKFQQSLAPKFQQRED